LLKQQDLIMIIYIGFSNRSHKLIARIFCRHFKHCAPVIIDKNKCNIYQFTTINNIKIVPVKKRDLKILEHYGWKFIKYNIKNPHMARFNTHTITCVQFTKCFCGIKNIKIQTPFCLFKYLTKK